MTNAQHAPMALCIKEDMKPLGTLESLSSFSSSMPFHLVMQTK